MKAVDLYEKDFARWTEQNAELLRTGRFEEADLEHIAEEIEDMGKERRHALRNQLRRLLTHLLKHQFQPSRRGTGWLRTIANARVEIRDVLEENPSLKPFLEESIPAAYATAVKLASIETKLPASRFPATCPYSKRAILDDDYLP